MSNIAEEQKDNNWVVIVEPSTNYYATPGPFTFTPDYDGTYGVFVVGGGSGGGRDNGAGGGGGHVTYSTVPLTGGTPYSRINWVWWCRRNANISCGR